MRFIDHALERMHENGVRDDEVRMALQRGQSYPAKRGRKGKEMVFPFAGMWRGKMYAQKLVRVIYVEEDNGIVVITVIAKYGSWGD